MASTPYARQRARELVSNARADLFSTVVQEGSFRKVDDGLFVQISERLPDGRLGSIFVADSRVRPGIDLVYYAKHGVVIDRDGNECAFDERRRGPSQGRRRRSLDHPLQFLCV